jgi:hypothetical protein
MLVIKWKSLDTIRASGYQRVQQVKAVQRTRIG